MVPGLVMVKESTGMSEAIEYMRAKGVPRLPVVDDNGGLVGILTLDDLLELLAEKLLALAKLVRHEQKKKQWAAANAPQIFKEKTMQIPLQITILQGA